MNAPRLIRPRLLLILLLVIVVRVVAIEYVHHRGLGPIRGDAITYDSLARHLAAGEGYLNQGRYDNPHPPLYPFLLAAVYRVAGPDPMAGAWLQVVFDVCGTLALAWLTRLVTGSIASADLAALGFALWPGAIMVNVVLYTEPLYTLLLLVATGVTILMERRGRLRWATLSGILFGLSALTRQTTLYFLIPYMIVMHLVRRGQPPGILKARLLAILVFVLTLVPWSAREQMVNGRVTWMKDYSGLNLWIGNHVPYSGRPIDSAALAAIHRRLGPSGRDDQVVNQELTRVALEDMRKDPVGTVLLWCKKFWRFMFVDPVGPHPAFRVVLTLGLAAIYVLAVVGARGLPPGSGVALGVVVAVFGYFAAVHTLTLVHIRLAEPARPLAFALAAHGVTLWPRRRV